MRMCYSKLHLSALTREFWSEPKSHKAATSRVCYSLHKAYVLTVLVGKLKDTLYKEAVTKF